MNLLPCPFCGHKARAVYRDVAQTQIVVECLRIDCGGNLEWPTPNFDDAINAWNTRHNAPPMIDEVPNLDSQSRNSRSIL